MKLSEIMRGYQSLNSVQSLFKSQSSFMYENLIENIFNNQHPSKPPLQHTGRKVFYPRDGWYFSSSLMKYHNHLSLHLTPAPIGQAVDTPVSCPLIGCWAAHSHRPAEADRLAFRWDKMPGRLLSVLLGADQWPNEEMMRSCNCSQPPPQVRPVSYFLPRERQFQFHRNVWG